MKEKVDVVTPYSSKHTPEEMLERAKQSVKNQTVETNHIVIRDEEQRGPAWARNRGLEKCENRYVAFLDADDHWDEDKLEKQLEKLKQEETGFCLCQTESEGSIKDPERSTERKFVRDVFLGKIVSFTPTIVIDRSKADISFDEELYRREDHLFALRAVKEAGVSFVDQPLCKVEKHAKGASSTENLEKKEQSYRNFYRKSTEIYPFLSKYRETYWKNAYHRLSRTSYYNQNFYNASKYAFKSVKSGPGIKNTVNMFLSLFKLVFSYFSTFISSN